jgi:outer membrane lipoprotein-sorting protein
MEAWSEGKDKSLVKILAPKKDRGIATLKVDKNIWNYLPKINRVTKIPPSMMMGSWMGSHFTNDDLVKESSYEDDYDSSITFSGERDGQRIYEVTSVPRPQAVVVWGKVVTEIAQGTLMPVRAVYFDEEGKPARTMTFGAARVFDGRRLPTRLVLHPEDKPGESTTVIYDAIRFDVKLSPELFSLRGLREQ